MSRIFLVLSILALFLGGCATLDENDRVVLQQQRVPPPLYNKMVAGAPLSLPDIVELSHRRVPTQLVIHYLKSTGEIYYLKSRDVGYLAKGGVSQRIIDYLLTTPLLYGGYGYYPPPFYPYNPLWYPYFPSYYSPPPPPLFIGGSCRYGPWRHSH